jgi:hypothetical protein
MTSAVRPQCAARVGAACAVAAGALLATAAFAQAARPRELVLVDGALPAAERLIKATKDDALRWRVTSDRAGELHVHAYRVSLALKPGVPAELAFTVHATGRFRVEWHAAGQADVAGGAHHAPPLAMLEVRPR